MAEEGVITSSTYGSDACYEHYCTPCAEDDLSIEAVKYCPECDEYLCTRCTRHHAKQKATKSHKLVDKKDANQSLYAVKTKCRYHPDRDIEMYCGTHDMVYCLLCIATDHRNCEQVDKIEVNQKTKVDLIEITQLLHEMTKLIESLNDVKSNKTKNLSSFEEQRNFIQKYIEDIEEKMIEHVRQLKMKTTDTVNEKYDVMKEENRSEIKLASRTLETLNESSQQLQSIESYSYKQKFICIKLAKKTIAEAVTIHDQSIAIGTSFNYFTERPELAEFIKTVDTLGEVVESRMTPIQ